jgi:hypothetical protein
MTEEHKSEEIKQIALAQGWKAQVEPKFELYDTSGDINDIVWHLYALRNKETLHVVWRGNRLESGQYVYGDYRLKLWWRVEVINVLKGKPDPTKFHKKEKEYIQSYEEIVETRSVPWDADSPAIDIMLAVIKKEVKWVRKIDGVVCTAVVDVDLKEKGSAKHFRVYEGKNGRVLEWADTLGFHAVALDQIIDVD